MYNSINKPVTLGSRTDFVFVIFSFSVKFKTAEIQNRIKSVVTVKVYQNSLKLFFNLEKTKTVWSAILQTVDVYKILNNMYINL